MFSAWLPTNSNKTSQGAKGFASHVILGTAIDSEPKPNQEEIIFACGCFWGAEKGFWKLPGVITTAVGYSGGHKDNPSYEQVCSGRTGHTEAVRVVWDTTLIDLSDLLKMFWECHDPTQGDRQGNDRGSQYRSAIYATNTNQLQLIMASLNNYQESLIRKGYGEITTEIKEAQKFYYAEEYHQQYLAKPGSRPYCSAMPTNIPLGNFKGAKYKLKKEAWEHFDWNSTHCVLRSNNNPISL